MPNEAGLISGSKHKFCAKEEQQEGQRNSVIDYSDQDNLKFTQIQYPGIKKMSSQKGNLNQ